MRTSAPISTDETTLAGRLGTPAGRLETASNRWMQASRPGRHWLFPEEILALILVMLTLVVNIVVNHTLNARVLQENVATYRTLFGNQLKFAATTLKYCGIAYSAWAFLRFVAGRPVRFVVWNRKARLLPALRALLVYFLCCTAFGNLQNFIHRLSPTDRDAQLMGIDRWLFFGHEPLKLLEPLVTAPGVRCFIQVYVSLFLVPFICLYVLLHRGAMRAFRDTILALVLALTIGYPGYLLAPAIGPQYTLRYLFVRPVFDVDTMLAYGIERLPRDCFPSLHTGICVTILIMVWRHSTSWLYRIAFTVWLAAIIFSTMYLRIHYVTDVIAGSGLGVLATYLAPRINDWYFRSAPSSGDR